MARIKLTKVDDGYVVSEGGTWLPGAYATEEAARLACTLEPSELERIWAIHRPHVMTVEDLSGNPSKERT